MKILGKMLTIVVIFSVFTLNIHAESAADNAISDMENLLPPSLSGIMDSPERLIEAVSPAALLEEIILAVRGEGGRVLSFLLLLLGCAVMCAVSGALSGTLKETCQTGVGVLCSLTVFGSIGGVFSSTAKALSEVVWLMSALAPIFTGLTVASGAAATAAAEAAGISLIISFFGGMGTQIMLSAVGLSLALALICALGDENISAISQSLGGLFKWVVGIATAAIAAMTSLQTVVASAADSAAMRAAKFAASGMIPVVGGAVSGALSTLAAGVSYAKGVIGVGAVAAMLAAVLSPLVILLLYRLAFVFATAFSQLLGATAAVKIFAAYRTALDSLIAVFSLCSVACIFEIILFMKGGAELL